MYYSNKIVSNPMVVPVLDVWNERMDLGHIHGVDKNWGHFHKIDSTCRIKAYCPLRRFVIDAS
ncbi:hypothetical protein WN55_08962 [Dufourea novaeangliae]|uniref:Uncharacterized protein n=1 Tax=Dufourea novaeangliae TaxID=178035 RepID=A0A154P4M3_DUFNO|nr:hypothetical protein WN55_08962 [Dufourea novaeangliae]